MPAATALCDQEVVTKRRRRTLRRKVTVAIRGGKNNGRSKTLRVQRMSYLFGSSFELNASESETLDIELSALSRAKAKQEPRQVGAACARNLEIPMT
jgi:hypothetical protein